MNQVALHSKLKTMASLRRASKDKDIIVGRFKPDGSCKKHTKHRQSPGVCSLCLSHKLSQLLSSSHKTTTSVSSSASSSLSSYSSSSASSCSSPTTTTTLHFPFRPTIFLLSAGLLKSRSTSVVPTRRRRREVEGDDDHDHDRNKKSGFWSKLLHPKSNKRMEEIKNTKLVHTRSLIQTTVT